MPWLKYHPLFKHGTSGPFYREITESENIEDIKSEIREMEGDPEGFREPLWEIIEQPPKKVVKDLLLDAQDYIAHYTQTALRYEELLRAMEARGD